MGRCFTAALLVVAGCDFQAGLTVGPDGAAIPDSPPVPDGAMMSDEIAHVRPDDRYIGTDDLMISTPIAIDTTSMKPGIALPPGATFAVAPQLGGGPELAILHVRRLDVRAAIRVRGTRPLVVIADAIDVSDLIDVAAHHDEPGPGAMAAGAGIGAPGKHFGSYTDSGGGGGSHGSPGAPGGPTTCHNCPEDPLPGGQAGNLYNAEAQALIGGSPGGRTFASPGTPCTVGAPGAGGGALELYARTQITIQSTGWINAGGGGGGGGDQCNQPRNWLAGHGGGAGGVIVLQSAMITSAGQLSANGGGGGAGGGSKGDGGDGEDGGRATRVAEGGASSGTYSAAGGSGAVAATAATAGAIGPASGNAGGGGGGVGHIVLVYRTSVTAGVASPVPSTKPF